MGVKSTNRGNFWEAKAKENEFTLTEVQKNLDEERRQRDELVEEV